ERGGHVHRHRGLVFVKLVQGAVDHRHRSRHIHFYRLAGLRLGKAQILDDGGGPSFDFPDDARHRARLLAAAINGFHRLVLEVDSLESGENVVDESGAALLAGGQQIQADALLVADAERRGVVLGFFQGRAFEAKDRAAALGLSQPARSRKTADGRRGDRGKLHGSTSQRFFFGYIRRNWKTQKEGLRNQLISKN